MRAYAIADVFTDTPLEGNAVAVFTDAQGLSAETMQRAARELNLSETVFVLAGDEDADARLRIFTPTTELPFAGHPVLGAAFVLGGRDRLDRVRLQTRSGLVTVTLERSGDQIVYGEMEQPIPTWELLGQTDAVLAALQVSASVLPIEVYDNGPRHAFVALDDDAALTALRPDFAALADAGEFGVSCFHAAGRDVHTRMFGPALGVNEDPATGSAAGPLAVHLARHGVTAFGETIEISQGAEIGRPSRLRASAHGHADRVDRVLVGGAAVIVAGGDYALDG